ncbi:MAG TPA: protease, partial [Solibacterales bacterium]|nr:protease [Bryobacterales bacterium]
MGFPKPEIMSPAGYWPQLHAAIDAGADSVYFGLKHFTARAKVGFSLEELPEVMRTLHRRGVKGFVTFNTLIFDHELEEAVRTVARIAESGADAVIVQDLGMVRLIRDLAPDLEIHASTQMSITDAEGVRLAARAGARRVTLARELSLPEVAAIREATETELEIFVHGALCVAYSGQCFSSEAWGGRSANRGQCAQACRLPYDMVVDGRVQPLADLRYLLSPGDLYALHEVPRIVATGISALKIEGRYKDADYVALATRAYREAVDEACAGRPLSVTEAGDLRLEQVYSRGLAPHFLSGTNHQTVVHGRAPRHRGVLMGRVVKVLAGGLLLETTGAHRIAPLKPGDGVVLDAAGWRSPEEPEEGGRIYEVAAEGSQRVEVRFGNREVDFSRVRPGDLLWRTHDPELDKTIQAMEPRRQPVDVAIRAAEGEPLRAVWTGPRGVAVTVVSPLPLAAAQNRGVDESFLREQFGRLGSTAFELRTLTLEAAGKPFAPASLLNAMRREAVEGLLDRLGEVPKPALADPSRILAAARPQPPAQTETESSIHLMVRSAGQLEAALALAPASIT